MGAESGFWYWWQNLPASLDPILVTLGPLQIRYYGLMYLVAFALTYFLAMYRIRRERDASGRSRFPYDSELIQNLLFISIIGVMLGGRLGYVLFYNFGYYLSNPLEAFLPFRFAPEGIYYQGFAGMSYHGGLIGVIVATLLFCRRYQIDPWRIGDLFAVVIPLGYTFGRLGNFINGELWGRPTAAAIGVFFPDAPGEFLRHPSQLYEALGEGVILFAVLWFLRHGNPFAGRKLWPNGAMVSFYLIGYALARFTVEFFREPDSHLGLLLFRLSMGQILSLAMMAAGLALYIWLAGRPQLEAAAPASRVAQSAKKRGRK